MFINSANPLQHLGTIAVLAFSNIVLLKWIGLTEQIFLARGMPAEQCDQPECLAAIAGRSQMLLLRALRSCGSLSTEPMTSGNGIKRKRKHGRSRISVLRAVPATPLKSHARAPAILVDELDASCLQGSANG